MIIKGLKFIQTCSASPEQYDVEDCKGKQVGYVRLRWGQLICEYPDVYGEVIYYSELDNKMLGCFKNKEQREYYLKTIANKILEKIALENS
ncbi:MAG: hypothetical protein HDT30_10005 [Clostridiales bacterium]|nr:hypothetical protein [Clostridiales bacterium]